MKRYYLKTQKDYNNLMSKLESQGYTWSRGEKPTELNLWTDYGKNTYVLANSMSKQLQYGGAEYEVVQHEAEKVVVPEFVAYWYEKNKHDYILSVILDELGATEDEAIVNWRGNCKGRFANHLANAEEIIAKMYLFEDYEIEEEKKYYWRKKEEYLLDFEEPQYLRMWSLDAERYYEFTTIGDSYNENGQIDSSYKCKFTESELAKDLGDEIKKLERVSTDGKGSGATVCC